jgi:hypothetical protein
VYELPVDLQRAVELYTLTISQQVSSMPLLQAALLMSALKRACDAVAAVLLLL